MFNNPQYNSIKIILLIVIVGFAGYFIFNNINNRAGDNSGKVFKNTNYTGGFAGDNAKQTCKSTAAGDANGCTINTQSTDCKDVSGTFNIINGYNTCCVGDECVVIGLATGSGPTLDNAGGVQTGGITAN